MSVRRYLWYEKLCVWNATTAPSRCCRCGSHGLKRIWLSYVYCLSSRCAVAPAAVLANARSHILWLDTCVYLTGLTRACPTKYEAFTRIRGCREKSPVMTGAAPVHSSLATWVQVTEHAQKPSQRMRSAKLSSYAQPNMLIESGNSDVGALLAF